MRKPLYPQSESGSRIKPGTSKTRSRTATRPCRNRCPHLIVIYQRQVANTYLRTKIQVFTELGRVDNQHKSFTSDPASCTTFLLLQCIAVSFYCRLLRTEAHRSPHVNYIHQRSKTCCDSFAKFQSSSRTAFHLTDLSPEEGKVPHICPDWDTANPQNKYQSFIPVKRKDEEVFSVTYLKLPQRWRW